MSGPKAVAEAEERQIERDVDLLFNPPGEESLLTEVVDKAHTAFEAPFETAHDIYLACA